MEPRTFSKEFYKAPKGKFKLMHEARSAEIDPWEIGDYDTREEAVTLANEQRGRMHRMVVYNDEGNFVHYTDTF